MPLSSLFAPLLRWFGVPATEALPPRTEAEQAQVDRDCARLALYQFQTCPYCVKVRRTISRLALNIESRDIRRERGFQEELIRDAGKGQVPCLRIEGEDGEARWLYESYDIVKYLEERFGAEASSSRK